MNARNTMKNKTNIKTINSGMNMANPRIINGMPIIAPTPVEHKINPISIATRPDIRDPLLTIRSPYPGTVLLCFVGIYAFLIGTIGCHFTAIM